MTLSILKFSGLLVLVLSVVFVIHISILHLAEFPIFSHKIVLAYIVNTILAIGIYVFMLILKNKYQSQLGFIFMFGSFIKFIVFFIVFYPSYKADGNISKLEFAAFFVPYLISLIIETSCLSKWLNKLS